MVSKCVGLSSSKCKKRCEYINNKGTKYCRRRSRKSCIGKSIAACKTKRCKIASGKSRTFCRRKKNRTVRR